MKKLVIGLAMVLALSLVANVAFTNETIPFPFWQHGWNIMSFWSVVNVGSNPATVTINGLNGDGTFAFSTTSTVGANGAWQPATYDQWWLDGGYANSFGFGNYDLVTDENALYLWGAVFASLADSSPGYTIVMPGNPYGNPL